MTGIAVRVGGRSVDTMDETGVKRFTTPIRPAERVRSRFDTPWAGVKILLHRSGCHPSQNGPSSPTETLMVVPKEIEDVEAVVSKCSLAVTTLGTRTERTKKILLTRGDRCSKTFSTMGGTTRSYCAGGVRA